MTTVHLLRLRFSNACLIVGQRPILVDGMRLDAFGIAGRAIRPTIPDFHSFAEDLPAGPGRGFSDFLSRRIFS